MVSGRFVTFCFAWLDVRRGSLVYSNAGHNPPLCLRADGSIERLADGGTVMGVFADAVFAQSEVTLAPGDRLLFYTDGITEAPNPAGEEFGEDRLAQVGAEVRVSGAEALKAHVLGRLAEFTGGTFADDATLIVAEIS
jgi:sigma-B regulation protein RsbU (phosphoserine phosphatase)